MTDAHFIRIADGIAAALNAASPAILPVGITAVRSYADFDLKLTEENTLKVDVVPAIWNVTQGTRGKRRYECTTSVGLRKLFAVADQDGGTGRTANAKVDELSFLLQAVAEYFAPCEPLQDGRRLASVPEAHLDPDKGVEVVPPYAPEFLEKAQFVGIVRLKFILNASVP